MSALHFSGGLIAGLCALPCAFLICKAYQGRKSRPQFSGDEIGKEDLAAIIDALPTPLFIKKPDSTLVLVNRAYETHSGIKAADLLGTDGRPHYPPDQFERYIQTDKMAIESRDIAVNEVGLTNAASGEKRHVLTIKKPLFDSTGKPLYIVCMFVDITERTNAERALRDSEERWKFAIEAAGGYVRDWLVQEDRIDYSKGWKAWLGMEDQEIGRSLADWQSHIHPDDLGGLSEQLRCCVEGGASTYVSEYRIRRKDGVYRWSQDRGIVIDRTDHGNAKRVISTSTDIEDAKRGESARLAQLAAQRDALVGEVHHRIKNSLQGIVGLLRQHKSGNQDLGEAIDSAIAQVQTIGVVHGLQGQAFGNEVVLCEMVPAISKSVEALMHPKCIFDVAIDVPQKIRIIETEAVPIALIVNEMAINAVKHSAEDAMGKQIGISVSWNDANQEAVVSITNPGRLPSAFDFETGLGTGLGLGLVRSLLPAHGGRLEYSQVQGKVVAKLRLFSPSIYQI